MAILMDDVLKVYIWIARSRPLGWPRGAGLAVVARLSLGGATLCSLLIVRDRLRPQTAKQLRPRGMTADRHCQGGAYIEPLIASSADKDSFVI